MKNTAIHTARKELSKLVREEDTFSWIGIRGAVRRPETESIEVCFSEQATVDKYQQQIGDTFKGFPVTWRVGENPFG